MAEFTVAVGLGLDVGPAEEAGFMNVGDTVVILPLDGEGEIVYPVPEGFTPTPVAAGFGFTATKANTGWPPAQFQVSGYSGKQIVVYVVVYP